MSPNATPFPNTLIRASAGSGKTFRLSSRYLGIVAHSGRPDEILATTFTRKAAGEILDRIMMRLALAAIDPKKLNELNGSLEGTPLTQADCLRSLHKIPQQMHRLQVKTLDSHFIRLAQCFSFELGLPPDWTIIDDVDDQRLRMDAVNRVLAHPETNEVIQLLHLLSKGSSERSVSRLVMNVVNDLYGVYLESDESSWQVLSVAAAPKDKDVEDAIEFLDSYPPDQKALKKAMVADVERFRAQLWAKFLDTGLPPKIIAGADTYSRKPIPDDVARVYHTLVRYVHSILIGRTIDQNRGAYQLLDRFHTHYERLKWQQRGYRFEDVTRRLSDALENSADIQNQFRLDRKIEHLLLDEFQDTSPVQWDVIRPVAQKIATQPKDRSILCVGDMKQAIYAWRGGVAEIFDAVQNTLPGINPEDMDKSYRSSPLIMETVNHIFGKLGDFPAAGKLRNGIDHWLKFFHPHETARQELPGHVTLESAPLDIEGKPCDDQVIALTAKRVAELHREAPHISIGVLVRRNATIASMIYLLRELNVMASEEGGNPLTDSAAVQLMLSLMEWIDHPGNTAARFHVAQSPLAVLVGSSTQTESQWEEVANDLRRELLVDGYGAAISRWAKLLHPECTPRELRRLEQLERLAFAYQGKATLRSQDFVQFIQSQRVGDSSSAAVRVMNIHQSKGLEFDAVFLPELDSRIPPQADSFVLRRDEHIGPISGVTHYVSESLQPMLPEAVQAIFEETQQKNVVESLCVLYVALTRAVHALHMVIKPRPMPKSGGDGPSKSFSGIILNGLINAPYPVENQVLYQSGDAMWYESTKQQPENLDTAQAAAEVRTAIQLKPAQKDALGEFVSPSSLEGGRMRRVKDLLKQQVVTAGMQYGSAMHHWMESVEWSETFVVQREQMIASARSQFGEFSDASAFEKFQSILESGSATALLNKSQYLANAWWPEASSADVLSVHREFPFAITHEGSVLRGSIDRLVLVQREGQVIAADVIDFKTDSFENESAMKDKVAHYRPQVNAYRQAVAQIFKLPISAIRAALLFVHGPKIVAWQEKENQ
ncbi:UvrD-helicase domain-containing protein [Bremerella alba]|uniref:DNA 3'-5' helicase n=1 Tax=Bremerella alba TaxID=980252 RepID=A0A7V8V633_9BACT|nr:UvrD-helicase domain-containing protein [Bremerella alba]MBA2115615.1 ATP-dependent helicase/nuclease subunit A [Bremerella alba]